MKQTRSYTADQLLALESSHAVLTRVLEAAIWREGFSSNELENARAVVAQAKELCYV